jgi:multidrug efflux pump
MMMGAYVLICGGMALAMWKLPGSFLPVEDQGEIMVQYTLPAGATAVRTAEVRRQVTDWFLTKRKPIPTSFSPSTALALAAADRTPGWPSCR